MELHGRNVTDSETIFVAVPWHGGRAVSLTTHQAKAVAVRNLAS
jgi:hypothetical protein